MEPLRKSMGDDRALPGFADVPEQIRGSYRIGRQAGRLMAELAVLVRAMAVRGGEPFDYRAYLAGLGMEDRYASWKAFVRGYFFDRRNPEALRSAAVGLARDVVVMRDALGTAAIAQARQAATAFDRAAMNQAPGLSLQKTCDCLKAFTGAAAAHLAPEERDAMRSGRAVERLRVALGAGAKKSVIWQELQQLLLLADGAVLPLDLAALYRLQVQGHLLAKNGRLIAERAELREAVEHVFRV